MSLSFLSHASYVLDSYFHKPSGVAVGFVEYNFHNINTIDIFETFVERKERGQGHAERLVEWVFQFCRKRNWRVLPSCTYVSGTFLDRNPHYRFLTFVEEGNS